MVRVLVHLDLDVSPRVRAAVPQVEVVPVPTSGPPDPDLTGDVLLTSPVGTDNLEQVLASGVRWVHVFGTGVDRFPLDRLGAATLTCSRGASATPIAEFVLACMLAVEKDLPATWVGGPAPRWGWAQLGSLRGRELGLVGLGGIGTEVARLALAFGMRVRATRRTGAPSPLPGVEVVPRLADLLPTADHLVLAAPATRRTNALLDAQALAGVRPGVHVVNVARGALVDQEALLAALDDGRVGWASLDVCEPEPLPAGHPLYAHPRVRLSPHVSWSAPGALDVILDLFLAELRRYVAGQPLQGVVDPAAGY